MNINIHRSSKSSSHTFRDLPAYKAGSFMKKIFTLFVLFTLVGAASFGQYAKWNLTSSFTPSVCSGTATVPTATGVTVTTTSPNATYGYGAYGFTTNGAPVSTAYFQYTFTNTSASAITINSENIVTGYTKSNGNYMNWAVAYATGTTTPGTFTYITGSGTNTSGAAANSSTSIYTGAGSTTSTALTSAITLAANTTIYFRVYGYYTDGTGSGAVCYNGSFSILVSPADPTGFTAAAGNGQNVLSATASSNVVLAYNTTNTFGTPSPATVYSAGNTIPGGGTVLYNGAAGTNFYTHSSLTNGTTYYYKLWSVSNTAGCSYSTGVAANATPNAPPTKLVITAITPASPTAGTAFTVTVQAQNAAGVASNVSASTAISLSTNGNAGAIGGTTTGTITAGTNSVTISGVTLPTPGTGVTITATRTSGDNLTAGTSAAFAVTFASAATDYFKTQASGNWNAVSTWLSSHDNVTYYPATLTPTNSAAAITVLATHTVTVTAAVSAAQLIVNAGGQITVNSGVTFTIALGSFPVYDCDVFGTILNSGTITLGSGAVLGFENGGLYQHNVDGGVIPTATWNTGSTCLVSGIVSTAVTANFQASLAQAFYNFTWNSPSQTIGYSLGGVLNTVNGNFSLVSTGTGSIYLANTVSATTTVAGSYIQSGGTLILCNTSGTSDNLSVKGNFNISGGSLQPGGGGGTVIFSGTTTQTYSKTGGTFSGSVPFVINSGAIVDFGTSIIDGSTGTFTLSSGGSILTANTGGLSATGATGTIQVTGTRTYSSAANYTYNGTAAQVTGVFTTTPTASTVNNLIIANAAGVTNSQALIIAGILNLSSGIFTTSVTNTLAVTNTATTAIIGGSTSAYVDGPLGHTLPANLTNSGLVYNYPIGDNGIYLPASLTTINTGSTAPLTYISANSGASGGSPDASLGTISNTEFWAVALTGSGVFNGASISLTRQTPVTPYNVIGKSASKAGVYTSIGGTASGNSLNNSNSIGSIAAGLGNAIYVLLGQTPVITVSALSPTSLTTTYGIQSSNMTYTVSGTGIINPGILITPPTGFEVSLSPSSGFANTLTLPATGGTVATTTIYVRLKVADAVGTYSGNITNTTGSISQSVAIATSTVSKATPSITGVTASQSITYGTASVTLSGTVSAAGPAYPANGTVNVTINGNTQNATISGGAGGFTVTFPTATIPASATPYTITYAYAGDANFTAAVNNTSTALTVNKATPTVTVTTGTYTYSGTPQGPNTAANTGTGTSYTYSYVGTGGTTYGPSATQPTNAGTYTVTATVAASADGNYNAASSAATAFSIGKATSSITVTGSSSYTYNGTAQGPTTYTESGSTGVVTFSYVGTGSTSYGPSSTRPTNAGTYSATATVAADANYNGATSAAFAFSIGKAAPTVTVTTGTYTYSGTPQGPNTAANTGTGTSYTYSYVGTGGTTYGPSATQPTNAGTYTVTATVAASADGNYNAASSAATAFSIGKATSSITVTGSSSYTYNGTAQGPTTYTESGSTGVVTFSYVGTGSTSYGPSSTRPTNAGTYSATATVAADANYNGATSAAFAFSIGKAAPTVTVTTGTYTYSGTPQGPNTAANTGTGTSYTYSYVGTGGTTYGPSATQPTNAGTYTVTATVAASADGNYNAASSAATAFSIGKATSSITVTGSSSYTYNGTAQGPTTYTESGSTGVVTFSYVGTGSTSYGPSSTRPTNAGTYSATATVAADANYNGATSAAFAFSIGKAAPTVTVTPGTYTYSETPQGPDATNTTNTGTGTTYTFSYSGTGATTYGPSATQPTNAGTYTVKATVAASADGNYNAASSATTAFSIGKATPTVTVAPGTYTYNGTPQGPDATNTTNTGTGTTYTFSYSGTGATTYGPSATKPTNAGTYTVTATVVVSADGNYNTANSAATAFGISPAALTITANDQTKCDGQTYTFSGTEFTNSALQNGETITTVTLTSAGAASGATPGTYSIVPSSPYTGTFNPANYTITLVNGTLTVTAATSITGQPSGATYCQNAPATALNVTATGTGTLTYQWYSNTANDNITGISVGSANGGQTASYTPSTSTAGTLYYYVIVTGTCGTATSNTAMVIVNAIATISNQSLNAACDGSFTLTPTAGGGDIVPAGTTYSWSAPSGSGFSGGAAGTNQASISGTLTNITSSAVIATYTVTPTTGSCSGSSFTVTVTVPQIPTAAISGSPTICGGSSANLSVTLTGTSPWKITYSDGSTNTTITGITSSPYILTVNPVVTTTYALVSVSGYFGCNGTVSGSATVTVNPNASITSVTGTSPLCIGSTATYAANGVVLGGGTGAWSSDNTIVATVNASTGVVTAQAAGTANIIYTVTGGCGGTVSAQQSLTVTPNASIASVTGTSPLCIGSTATYTANGVVLGGGTGLWSSDNTTVATVNASTGVVTAQLAGTANIIYTITGGCGGTVSAQQLVTVNPASVSGSISGAGSVCSGTNSTTLTLSGYTGTIQWQSSPDNTTFTDISGATSSTYTATNLTATTYYQAVVTSGVCSAATSASVAVTVNPVPVVANKSLNAACDGSFTLTPANGGDIVPPGTTYSWSAPSGSGFTGGAAGINQASISGTLTNTTSSAVTATYTVTPTSGSCSGTTFTVTVTVPQVPTADISGTQTICAGSSANLSVMLTGTSPWKITYSDGSTNTTITGITSSPYTLTVTPVVTTTYSLVSVSGYFGCNGTVSGSAVVTVNQQSADPASASATSPTICYGGSTMLVLSGGGGGGTGEVIHWYTGSCGGTSVGTGNNLSVSPTVTTTYYGRYEDGAPCNYVSNCALVTVTIGPDTWTGTASSQWNQPGNWTCGIPSIITDVIIPDVSASGNFAPIVNLTSYARNITVQAGGSLSVALDDTLKISGSITKDPSAYFDASIGTIELNGTSDQTLLNAFTGNVVKNLIISNNVIIDNTSALSITGILSFGSAATHKTFTTNDSLTLKSGALRTAAVDVIDPTNTITGNVTVERYIATGSAPNHAKSWQLLAIPTSDVTYNNGQSINNAWQEGATAPNANPHPGYGTMITSNRTTAIADGFDAYTAPGPSVKAYDTLTNDYDGPVSTAVPIFNKKGYFTFVRGDRGVTTFNAPPMPTILRTKGILFTPAHPPLVTTLGAGKFESVGNPYAAPIDMRKITISIGIDSFFQVWDPRLGGSYNYGAFQTFNRIGNDYYATPGGGSYGSGPYNYIQSGQAFFMQSAPGMTGTVTFNESAKAVNAVVTSIFTRQASGSGVTSGSGGLSTLRTSLNTVNADGSTKDLVDGVLDQFDDSYSNAIDRLDARKIPNTGENLSVKTTGTLLAIERRHTVVQDDTIHLNLTGERVQQYRYHFEAQNMSTTAQGFVIDNYKQTRTPLNLNGTTDYDFSVENVAGSYAADRFMVVFSPLKALPVTFTSIKAYRQDKNIAVEWRVSNENNIKQYQVEQSVNGKDFTLLTTQKPTNNNGGSAVYTATDTRPVTGDNYYRIRSVDVNGAISYTTIVEVTVAEIRQEININPNPITDGQIHLQFINEPAGKYGLRLLNSLGQTIMAKQVTRQEGTDTQLIRWDFNLAHGMYKLEVTKPDGSIKIINVLY